MSFDAILADATEKAAGAPTADERAYRILKHAKKLCADHQTFADFLAWLPTKGTH